MPPKSPVPHQGIHLLSYNASSPLTHHVCPAPATQPLNFLKLPYTFHQYPNYYIPLPPSSSSSFTTSNRAKRRKYKNTNLNDPSHAPSRDATPSFPALSPPTARFLVNRCLAHQTTHSARQSPVPQTAYPIRSRLRRRRRLPGTDRASTRQQRENRTRVGRGYNLRKSTRPC